jgi:hypothetical protein
VTKFLIKVLLFLYEWHGRRILEITFSFSQSLSDLSCSRDLEEKMSNILENFFPPSRPLQKEFNEPKIKIDKKLKKWGITTVYHGLAWPQTKS